MLFPNLLATVLIDPPTALVIGCAVAWISFKLIHLDPEREVFRTGVIGAAAGVIYAFSVGWFFFAQPDWMFAYLRDARTLPLLPLYVAFVACLAGLGAMAAVGTAQLLRARRLGWAGLLTAGALLSLALPWLLQAKQYGLVGSYEDYLAGRALPLQQVPQMNTAMGLAGGAGALLAVGIVVLRVVQTRRATRGAGAGQGAGAA